MRVFIKTAILVFAIVVASNIAWAAQPGTLRQVIAAYPDIRDNWALTLDKEAAVLKSIDSIFEVMSRMGAMYHGTNRKDPNDPANDELILAIHNSLSELLERYEIYLKEKEMEFERLINKREFIVDRDDFLKNVQVSPTLSGKLPAKVLIRIERNTWLDAKRIDPIIFDYVPGQARQTEKVFGYLHEEAGVWRADPY